MWYNSFHCRFIRLFTFTVLSSSQARQFVVGGSDAAEGAWPWQLSHRNGGSHSCGSSLIRPNWSVTAAHCVGGAVYVFNTPTV